MADKQDVPQSKDPETPMAAITQLQEAGFGNLMGMGTAWVEAFSDMGAEVMGFVADRIKEDVKRNTKYCTAKTLAISNIFRRSSSRKQLTSTKRKLGNWLR